MDSKVQALNLEIIELEMQEHIDEMKSEVDMMVQELHRSIKKQREEFVQDVEWDLKGFEKIGDHAHEFNTDVRELKKEFSHNVSELQEEIKTSIETLGEKVDTRLDILRDLSELELSIALDEIIEQAKNDKFSAE